MLEKIEIESCDNCKFSYENDEERLCCNLAKLEIEDVLEKEVHKDCPLRRGPISFCLAKSSAGPTDVARLKKCRDCGKDFRISYGELEYLKRVFEINYTEPSRCRTCRKTRKTNANSEVA